jgi:hypothetical protein
LFNDQVGITTQSNVIIWTVDSGIKQIPTTMNSEAVIFHPTSQDAIVLISSLELQRTDPKHFFILRSIAEERTHVTEFRGITKNSTLNHIWLDWPEDNLEVHRNITLALRYAKKGKATAGAG